MKVFAASLLAALGLLATPVQAAEPLLLQPVHASVVSTGAFALYQPDLHCFNGCTFHYFAPGDTYTADYAVQGQDGYWYYVVTVDGVTGYVLRPPVISFGA